MTTATREDVLAILRTIRDPKTGRDPVSLDWVEGVVVKDGHVTVALKVTWVRTWSRCAPRSSPASTPWTAC